MSVSLARAPRQPRVSLTKRVDTPRIGSLVRRAGTVGVWEIVDMEDLGTADDFGGRIYLAELRNQITGHAAVWVNVMNLNLVRY